MTAEDPKGVGPAVYVHSYFEKLNSEIGEDVCHDEE
jgi:hypothetical protein